eukprot:m.509161 g.509161  ORF g.509161 m.509161 type:complete len:51 (+) comp91621_c0_seq1:104-256(+)
MTFKKKDDPEFCFTAQEETACFDLKRLRKLEKKGKCISLGGGDDDTDVQV